MRKAYLRQPDSAAEADDWSSAEEFRARCKSRETAMSKLVSKTLADTPVTPARKRRLAQLANRPDAEIDFSDIPPLNRSFWENAVRNPFYRPIKQQLTVRLDADVVAWLRQHGKGYQTNLNRMLCAAMREHIGKSA
jgi:uncharacterized protein (DUF4415 family)